MYIGYKIHLRSYLFICKRTLISHSGADTQSAKKSSEMPGV